MTIDPPTDESQPLPTPSEPAWVVPPTADDAAWFDALAALAGPPGPRPLAALVSEAFAAERAELRRRAALHVGGEGSLDAGDEGRFQQMLSTIATDYPEGDLAGDGIFELALNRIVKRDWAGAIPALEQGLARKSRERAYFAAGRFPYYLGRAHLETGATEKGLAELASVIRDYPLSYYMALAYARLAESSSDTDEFRAQWPLLAQRRIQYLGQVIIEYFRAHRADLSEDSQDRLERNPLRIDRVYGRAHASKVINAAIKDYAANFTLT